MARKVNTVLGEIDAKDLGRVLMHEHFYWEYPGSSAVRTLFPYDRKKIVEGCLKHVKNLKENGIDTVVDFTCNDMGRDVEVLKEISERGEINIIFPTGLLYEVHGGSAYWRQFLWRDKKGAYEEMYELFMKEVTEGVEGTGIKPGYLKSAGGLNGLSEYEEMVFTTVARVAKETGIRVCSHTEQGTYGPEIAKFYMDAGLDPKQVCINHMCGNSDKDYVKAVFDQGVFLAFDRFGLQGWMGAQSDENRLELVLDSLKKGKIDQMFISCDTNMEWGGSEPIWPGAMNETYHIEHMFEWVLPTLKANGVTQEQIDQMMIVNPRRFFGDEA